jgi:hypothetical protein
VSGVIFNPEVNAGEHVSHEGTIALVSDGGRAHCITAFI